jgi:small subunit ribosomal protein S1
VRIKVLDIDRERQRISLGLKQTQEDPWQRVISTHRPGDVLEGTVTKVVAFGAFVEILPGVEGLVHISELADHHVESPSEVVEPGTVLNVKILEIDEERRRLSLSIKRVEGDNMPMGDLGEQLQSAAEASAEGSDAESAGPVAEDDTSSSQAAGEEPSSAPPAEEASDLSPEAPAVEAAAAESEAEVAEPEAEAVDEGGESPEAVQGEPEGDSQQAGDSEQD